MSHKSEIKTEPTTSVETLLRANLPFMKYFKCYVTQKLLLKIASQQSIIKFFIMSDNFGDFPGISVWNERKKRGKNKKECVEQKN